jgi:hypothetical protein
MDQATIIDRVGRAPTWHDQAACKGLTERFFPITGKVFDERPAKAVCAQVPRDAGVLRSPHGDA